MFSFSDLFNCATIEVGAGLRFGSKDFEGQNLEGFAHVIIDPQRAYCDPRYYRRIFDRSRGNRKTERVSGHLAEVVKSFRAVGVPTYIVYFTHSDGLHVDHSAGGLYKVEAGPSDYMMWKREESAFESGPLHETLLKNGHKKLLVSGFNTAACLAKTVYDGLNEDFKIWVLNDCIANDNMLGISDIVKARAIMKREGAKFIHHSVALNAFEEQAVEQFGFSRKPA